MKFIINMLVIVLLCVIVIIKVVGALITVKV